MRSFTKALAVSLALLAGSTALANEPPPVPEGGLQTLYSSVCTDKETGIGGVCFLVVDIQGNTYLLFFIDEKIMFIRKMKEDGYDLVWMHDKYNSV